MATHLVNLYTLLNDLSKIQSDRFRPVAMGTISQALLAALKTLSSSTLRIRQIISRWLIRLAKQPKEQSSSPVERPNHQTFAKEVDVLFDEVFDPAVLLRLSDGLREQFSAALVSDAKCMLPSYNHQLPRGSERGRFLALDVGGSTFRVALIELLGSGSAPETVIRSQASYKITDTIKQLRGVQFFDWLAERIEETLSKEASAPKDVIPMGLAWSFPVEQTSLRSGLVQDMGKGFMAAEGLYGQDLGDILQEACERRNLKVQVDAIVNDTVATLLSKAYSDPTTRFGLILGTGANIALHLPVEAVGQFKFGVRPSSWHEQAKDVLINTELGMFGKGVLPMTRWDVQLNERHARPDFQPLEFLLSGRYLGEIARLVLVEAIQTTNLFDGIVPISLQTGYTLDTELLAHLQSAKSSREAAEIFNKSHPTTTPITEEDADFLCFLAEKVSKRATAILAAAIHALWRLRTNAREGRLDESKKVMIACHGSVIQNYPGFKQNCQKYLDELVQATGSIDDSLILEEALESSLLGAAVAVAAI